MPIFLKDKFDILKMLCRSTKQWGILFSTQTEDIEEFIKAAPFLNKEEHISILLAGEGTILFDTEEQMYEYYYQIVGDDGPTKKNSYNGDCRVYAVTCDPEGNLLTENT